MRNLLCGIALAAVFVQPAVAQVTQADAPAKQYPPAVTKHTGTFNGKKVAYTATVDETIVPNAAGRPSARIVSVAYTADGANPATRPVVFVSNGGPIAPSVYLHMIGMGPRVLSIPEDLKADTSQFKLVDNPNAVLDVADLVFFDPASTGWSRVLDGVKVEEYYTTEADAQQLAAFVDRWTRENGRTASPKYLLGESYATIRVPEAARILARLPEPVLLDGVFLMGQATNQLEVNTRPYNIISPAIGLPSIAATAWYHNKVDRKGTTSVFQWMDSARAFSANEYINALFKGTAALDDATKNRIAGRLQSLTGIPASYFLANNLRINRPVFQRELFKAEGMKLGSDDARYIGPVQGPEPDAAPASKAPSMFEWYAKNELKVTRTEEFRRRQFPPSTAQQGRGQRGGGGGGWQYASSASPFNDFAYTTSVTDVMNKNPKFRVYVGSGIFDMKTTTGAADYLIAQSGWPKDRVRVSYYEGGHMAYTNPSALKQFNADVRAMAEGK